MQLNGCVKCKILHAPVYLRLSSAFEFTSKSLTGVETNYSGNLLEQIIRVLESQPVVFIGLYFLH